MRSKARSIDSFDEGRTNVMGKLNWAAVAVAMSTLSSTAIRTPSTVKNNHVLFLKSSSAHMDRLV